PDGVALDDLISHRFPLAQAPDAFALNLDYADSVQKIIIDI
ncbi:MAG: alcohol dehydrogenase, partial [Phototrophicales bacterium]